MATRWRSPPERLRGDRVEELRQPKQIDDLLEADLLRVGRRCALPRAKKQVAPHGKMREEARFLEDVADRPLVRAAGTSRVLPDVAVDRKGSLEPLQAGDAAQNRRLAAAGRSEESGDAASRCGEGDIEIEPPEPAAERDPNPAPAAHSPARATRFSISVMARMTAKAKTTMPAARMLASRHCEVSTKS